MRPISTARPERGRHRWAQPRAVLDHVTTTTRFPGCGAAEEYQDLRHRGRVLRGFPFHFLEVFDAQPPEACQPESDPRVLITTPKSSATLAAVTSKARPIFPQDGYIMAQRRWNNCAITTPTSSLAFSGSGGPHVCAVSFSRRRRKYGARVALVAGRKDQQRENQLAFIHCPSPHRDGVSTPRRPVKTYHCGLASISREAASLAAGLTWLVADGA